MRGPAPGGDDGGSDGGGAFSMLVSDEDSPSVREAEGGTLRRLRAVTVGPRLPCHRLGQNALLSTVKTTLISGGIREKNAATRGGQRCALNESVSFPYSKRSQPSL